MEFFNYLQFLPGETLPLVTISVYMYRLEMEERNYMCLYFFMYVHIVQYEYFGLFQHQRHLSWACVSTELEFLNNLWGPGTD